MFKKKRLVWIKNNNLIYIYDYGNKDNNLISRLMWIKNNKSNGLTSF